ncbi:MarR family winged helix-turn-helix transcriptional regulator [Frigidibacter oleivorans]|uniref:MarR family winged helix-turn-helix transcriptional regulator n=1 Tax=Frigidibacter oleivorans TaxID=2487129 RepID=UPI000F8D01E8|nr:MarR family transcriptional regulator [Frigidibacter oleivorans]
MSSEFTDLPSWVLSSAATRSHRQVLSGLRKAGFDGYEYRCIAILAGTGRMSQARLGEAVLLDPRDVTHTVRSLEERGLIRREPDPKHGRKKLVSLTEAGQHGAIALKEVMADVQDAIFGALDARQRITLIQLLRQSACYKR